MDTHLSTNLAGLPRRPNNGLNRSGIRGGGTLLEVLFAIFVVVVGLSGIASLLPLAARNASESNAHNTAQALGQQWFNSFFSYHLNAHQAFTQSQIGYNWLWYADGNSPSFIQFSKSSAPSTTGSTIRSGASLNRMWAHQAVCLDPMFFTEREVRSFVTSGTAEEGAYRLSVFPYFEDGYNPLTDPATATDPWTDQPRMVRITLGFDRASQVSRKLIEDMFASADDVNFAADQTDRTIPAFRKYDKTLSKGLLSGQYSWMATLIPNEPLAIEVAGLRDASQSLSLAVRTTRNYLLSLVIMNRRDRLFLTPGAPLQAESSDDKPAGERLVWVYPLSGSFSGGTGGRVRLICDASTNSDMHVGDWIMLGKYYAIDPVNTSQRYSYQRWYRIIGMDRDPKLGSVASFAGGTDPFGNAAGETVWARDVVLEGPDFNLDSSVLVNGNAVATPVSGTIVSGVVTVVDRNVLID